MVGPSAEPLVYSDYSWRLYSDSSVTTIPTKTCTVLWYAATTRTILYPRSVIRRAADRMRHASCCATRKWNAVQSCSAKRRRMRPLCIREVQGSRKPTVKQKTKASGSLAVFRQSSRTLDFPALQIKPFPDVYSPGTARMPETAIRPLHFIPRPTQVPLRPKEAFRRVPKQA